MQYLEYPTKEMCNTQVYVWFNGRQDPFFPNLDPFPLMYEMCLFGVKEEGNLYATVISFSTEKETE